MPLVGAHEPGRNRTERRLPRAVRAEQRDDGAGRHVQRDAVDDLDFAVARDDATERERRLRRRPDSGRLPRRAGRRGRRSCSGTTPSCTDASTVGDPLCPRALALLRASFFSSRRFPVSARMPSGSFANWIALSPNRIDVKYVELRRSDAAPPGRMSLPIQWKTAGAHANASPASNAPPGRRIPKVTASASQNKPASGVAVVLVTVPKLSSARNTPPKPAIPADSANSLTLVRPDVDARRLRRDFGAPNRERRATGRRPEQGVDHRGDDAEEAEQQHDLLRNLREIEARSEDP